jgi:hypothetical protein
VTSKCRQRLYLLQNAEPPTHIGAPGNLLRSFLATQIIKLVRHVSSRILYLLFAGTLEQVLIYAVRPHSVSLVYRPTAKRGTHFLLFLVNWCLHTPQDPSLVGETDAYVYRFFSGLDRFTIGSRLSFRAIPSLSTASATTVSSVQLGYISCAIAFRSGLNFYRACRYRDGERNGFVVACAETTAAACGGTVTFPSKKSSRS